MRSFVQLERAPSRGPKRPRRIPHTHLGQLLNEFELGADALAALEAIRDLPPAERAEGAMAVLRRFPGSTAAAIALMVALRQAGQLDGRREAVGPSPIPRRIAQFWDAKEPPADLRPLMASWAKQNPDHEVLLFDDEAARGFLARHLSAEVLDAYERAPSPTQKSDVFRLAWLYASGGWYADCDDRCHAPLATIAPPGATLVAHQEELGSLCNNLVGAVPQHEVIGRALRDAVAAARTGDSDYLWLATGPGCLTRAAAETLADPILAPRRGWAAWPCWGSASCSRLWRFIAVPATRLRAGTGCSWPSGRAGPEPPVLSQPGQDIRQMISQFLRFGVVGGVGFLVDAGVLMAALALGMDKYSGRALSYLAAVSTTFALNRAWTFRDRKGGGRVATQWGRFAALNLVGFTANYGTYALLVGLAGVHPLPAVAAGSLAGMGFNFFLSRRYVFREA
ncbi:GtrA family protein [Sabulicella rubraurantiaca]|uniref:GtrA family protein n=1 Tax=Sabulicella rubraurantiaca TaxID=2811429 RepID=UPI001A95942E|nr:GtrA family protein [Sabulicella rubraurantiaca]